jgi:hypothetical protein
MASKGEYLSDISNRRPVLEGHKQKGKKVFGPFSDLKFTQISFTADIFPELLWLAMVFDRFGYHRGLDVAMQFQAALYKYAADKPWYRLSEIAKIEQHAWLELPEADQPFKRSIEEALAPVAFSYPELSISFVRSERPSHEEILRRLSNSVARFSNRFEVAGCLLIGGYIFLQAFVGRVQVPRKLLDGINLIFSQPDSLEADIASSSIRAFIMASWSIDAEDEGQWPKAFWRANHRLSACEVNAQG